MLNLTFDEVRKFVAEEHDTKLLDTADALLGVALLLAPVVAGVPQYAVEPALGLLTVKNDLIKAGKALFRRLSKSGDDDTVRRQKRMHAAFALICYTSFFDSLDEVAPDIIKVIGLDSLDKVRLAQSSTQEADPTSGASESCSSILEEFGIPLPHPADTLDQINGRLTPLYQALTKGVLRFVDAFQGWQALPDRKKVEIVHTIETLPTVAFRRFRSQYFELAARNKDFYVWANLKEHDETRTRVKDISAAAKTLLQTMANSGEKLDLGLSNLQKQLTTLPQAIESHAANAVLQDLKRSYEANVQEPIIRDPAEVTGARPVLNYPSKSQIFVPQYFKVLRYTNTERLEDEATWRKLSVRKNLGDYLLAYLDSPYSTQAPLIILGHPGSGKSLLTQIIAARLTSDTFAPIRVELRSIDAENEIEAQIEEQIRKDIGRTVQFATLMDYLGSRPAVLIFDGYDELLQATGQVFANYLTRVQKFQERESRSLERNPIRTIITSRITLIDKALIPANATILRLLEFDEEQRTQWITVWNKENQGYFNATSVKPFKLESDKALIAIAEQPLLLLMLALYDSKANQLRTNRNLDQSVLYDSLLRRFIERERMKSQDFLELVDDKKRETEIDRDMERLGVAAIGMFNRHALHIRATQLNGDLEFFQLRRDMPSSSGRPLSQAELLLGSFFFVHESRAEHKSEGAREREVDAAFEFLHNTFGEFLTGQFIVRRLLSETNKLFKLRRDADLHAQRNQTLTDPDGLPTFWHATLMHASLFSRPVILAMLREWFKHALARTERTIEDILVDLDDILVHEIRRVLSGRTFPSIMVHKESSFERLPLIGYLANYTLNLITLRTIISPGGFVFDERKFETGDRRPRSWDRLAHLWKAWFSTEALNPLSTIFTARRDGEAVVLKMRDDFAMATVGKRLDTVLNIGVALGDNSAIALAGLTLYDSFKNPTVTLRNVADAAKAEGLELGSEVLLRELRDASRVRRDSRERERLRSECLAAVEELSLNEIGTAVDIVRALQGAVDLGISTEVTIELLRSIHNRMSQLSVEGITCLLRLMYDVERVAPLHSFEQAFSQYLYAMVSSDLSAVPADLLFLSARWIVLRGGSDLLGIADIVNENAQDELYLSTLSPTVALHFVRMVPTRRGKSLEPSVSGILRYYLSPDRLMSLHPEVGAGLLRAARRQRYRDLLTSFCDALAQRLTERDWPIDHRHGFDTRFQFRMMDTDRSELFAACIDTALRYGTGGAKERIYDYAVHRWLYRGFPKLSLSILRLARSVDEGGRFLAVLDERVRSRGRRVNTNAAIRFADILGIELRHVSLEHLDDIRWLAARLSDEDLASAISRF
jgi:hypothetical protein